MKSCSLRKINVLTPLVMVLALSFGNAFAAQSSSTKSSSSSSASDKLDQKKIHAEYNDGNFEKVLNTLETFMAAHKSYSLDDSVFIAKHLAVVYTANPSTREKGKYYMFRLLTLVPSAKLVDMFVSDEIDRIFDKVREEFMARQRSFGVDTTRMVLPQKGSNGSRGNDKSQSDNSSDKAPVATTTSSSGSHTGFWVAGGAAVAVAGLSAAYFLLQNDPAPSDKVYRVPKN